MCLWNTYYHVAHTKFEVNHSGASDKLIFIITNMINEERTDEREYLLYSFRSVFSIDATKLKHTYIGNKSVRAFHRRRTISELS